MATSHHLPVIRGKSATWGVLTSRADIGGMVGLLVAPEARNTAQVIPGLVSGNGRVSGNANDPDIRAQPETSGGTWDLGLILGLWRVYRWPQAPRAERTAQVIPGLISGNGRTSGNAKGLRNPRPPTSEALPGQRFGHVTGAHQAGERSSRGGPCDCESGACPCAPAASTHRHQKQNSA